jgi:hypothetical protein
MQEGIAKYVPALFVQPERFAEQSAAWNNLPPAITSTCRFGITDDFCKTGYIDRGMETARCFVIYNDLVCEES